MIFPFSIVGACYPANGLEGIAAVKPLLHSVAPLLVAEQLRRSDSARNTLPRLRLN